MKLFVFVGNVTQNAGAVCPEDRLAEFFGWYRVILPQIQAA